MLGFWWLLQTILSTVVLAEKTAPRKVTLTSRRAAYGESLQRRALSPLDLPLANFFNGTDLQWYGNISVGTPPQHTTVVFDTGSTNIEITSTFCDSCIHQIQFDPFKSSTFVDGGQILNVSFGTGVGVDPVINDNYRMVLRNGADTISVGELTSPNVSMFLVMNQTSTFDIDPFSGILGMGPESTFFGGLIEQGLPCVSFWDVPYSAFDWELTFGGIDESKFTGDLTFASLPFNTSRYWQLQSSGIYVNGKTTELLSTPESIPTVIFDSGTSNAVFSTNITEVLISLIVQVKLTCAGRDSLPQFTQAIYSLISPQIRPNPAEPGSYGIPCELIPRLPAVIDIGFTAQDGTPFNLTIPSCELSVGSFPGNPSLCQTLINALDGLAVIGGSLLKHYYSVWDVEGQRLGFASAV